MKHIFAPAALLIALLVPALVLAQWTLDCSTVTSPSSATQGILQLRNGNDGQQSYYYTVDSLRLRIYANPCAQSATYTYNLNAAERNSYYRYVWTTPVDLTGDGVSEIILLTYTLSGSNSRIATKILDITNSSVLLERRDSNLSFACYGYNIADINNDGVIECVVTVTNPSGGAQYSEIYNTGVAASGVPPQPGPARQFTLAQNYPNPFNPTTRIEYRLDKPGHVGIDVFNMLGQRVASLVNGYQPQGAHSIEWNSRDDGGIPLSSGTYLYEVSIDGRPSGTRKMVLLR